jgi:PAS domain S-box-containing protein
MKDEEKTKDQLMKELTELRHHSTLSNKFEKSKLQELEKILEILPIGIVYLDADFRFISANKFIHDMTGLSENDLKGKFCYETVGEYSNDPAKEGVEKICSFCKKDKCFKSKKSTVMERPLGNSIIKVTTIPELNENGDITSFLEVVENITEGKQKESETIRASQLVTLGELAAGVAHEINNPINGVVNYAQILVDKMLNGSKEEDIARRIVKEGNRVSVIVHSLLSFARQNPDKKMSVNVSDILSEALTLTMTQLRKDNIHMDINMPKNLPRILANPQQLQQVFLNILNNARYALNQKYPNLHEYKKIEIRGDGKATMNNTSYVRISFIDYGIGILLTIYIK